MQKYFSFDEYDAFRNLMLAMMNTRFCYFLIIHFTLNEPLKFKNLVKPKIRRKNLVEFFCEILHIQLAHPLFEKSLLIPKVA